MTSVLLLEISWTRRATWVTAVHKSHSEGQAQRATACVHVCLGQPPALSNAAPESQGQREPDWAAVYGDHTVGQD